MRSSPDFWRGNGACETKLRVEKGSIERLRRRRRVVGLCKARVYNVSSERKLEI